VVISSLENREDYQARLEENESLKALDEEFKLIVGYYARKHTVVRKLAKIQKVMKKLE